jgi:hypothetical protein
MEMIMIQIYLFTHDFSGKPVSIPVFTGTCFSGVVLYRPYRSDSGMGGNHDLTGHGPRRCSAKPPSRNTISTPVFGVSADKVVAALAMPCLQQPARNFGIRDVASEIINSAKSICDRIRALTPSQ